MTKQTPTSNASSNIDPVTVASFGSEWAKFDQEDLSTSDMDSFFDGYFGIFPWDNLPVNAEGFDMGCGSGRWARRVAKRVGKLNCIDASDEALNVAKKNLKDCSNTTFIHAAADVVPLQSGSQDFGYSLGVLHHIPDTSSALKACTKLLKPGAPFLLYIYYRFDNRPLWFRALWRSSNFIRNGICQLPERLKSFATDLLATFVYWPLARLSLLVEKLGGNPSALPLSFYRQSSFYSMRTDSRDRFGTPLEQRFTREEISDMMVSAGLGNITFSENEPYWVAVGTKDK